MDKSNINEKKVITQKKSTAPPKKNIIKKDVVEKDNDKPAEATPPTVVKTAGWKKTLEEKKAFLKPRSLRTKVETWDSLKKSNEKRKKGVIILLDGKEKVGKSNFSQTSSRFNGFSGKWRIIPSGKPTYILDTEGDSVEDEAEYHFKEELDGGNIKIQGVYVENPQSKEIDPIKSMEKLEEWAYSLESEEEGTLVVDNFSDYCEWAYYKLVEVALGDKYGWTEDGVEKKKVTPIQYKWRNKKVKSFLRALRNMKMNVILISQVKDEWIQKGDSTIDSYKSGELLTDVIGGTGYWVDIIARYEKEVIDGKTIRRIIVIDSRFETEDMKGKEYILEGNPTFEGLINLFKDVL